MDSNTDNSSDNTGVDAQSDMSADLEALRRRLGLVRQEIDKQADTSRRKQRILLFVGILIVSSSVLSMLSITRAAAELDPRALTQIARYEVEKQLPDGRRNLEEYFQGEAPRIVGQLVQAIFEHLPQLRHSLVEASIAHFQELNDSFEQSIGRRFSSSLRNAKAGLDLAYPDADDNEKLEQLMRRVASEFNTSVELIAEELYPQYSSEMSRVHAYLTDITNRKENELSDKEKLHKEILETLLQLMLRAQDAETPR